MTKNNNKKLSVSIITYNEEERIEKTLKAIRNIASEIIIVDSSSTDKTLSICKKYKAKIYNKSWSNFADQKNYALSKCSSEFILSLDADEELSPELINEILSVINSNEDIDGYILKRKTLYLGKLLNHSWQPDKTLRLIKKSANPKFIGSVHEELKIDSDKIKNLNSYIYHHSYKNINDHNHKTIYYAKLSAEQYFAEGKRASFAKLLFSPIINFIRMYIFRLGFLDGIEGLIAATSGYTYTFYKYSFLYELTRNERQV